MCNVSVLIIEDDVFITNDIVEIVHGIGCKVAGKAKSYEEALAVIKKNPVDLIISDVKIEGDKDGLKSVKLLQKVMDAPVIFITSYSDNEIFTRASELEFVGFLMKPFKENQLTALIHIAVSRFELAKQKNIKAIGGGFSYCEESRAIYKDDEKVVLTENEKILFEMLYNAKNSIVPYGVIDEVIWSDTFPDDNKRRQLFHRLKNKFEGVELSVMRGEGYKLLI